MTKLQVQLLKHLSTIVSENATNTKSLFGRVVVHKGATYFQLISSIALVTIRMDQAQPTEIRHITSKPETWKSTDAMSSIFKGASDAAVGVKSKIQMLSDAELSSAATLLSNDYSAHPKPIQVTSDSSLVLAAGKGALWLKPTGTGDAHTYEAVWRKNDIELHGVYTYISPWTKQLVSSQVMSGINQLSMTYVYDTPLLTAIDTNNGFVVSMMGVKYRNTTATQISYILNNSLHTVELVDDSSYEECKKEEDMKTKLMSPLSLMPAGQVSVEQPVEQPVETPAETPAVAEPVQVAEVAESPAAVNDNVAQEPTEVSDGEYRESTSESPVSIEQENTTPPTEEKQQEPVASSMDLIVAVREKTAALESVIKDIKATIRELDKTHRAELRSLKADTKSSEELSKLREDNKALRAKLARLTSILTD